MFRKDQEIDKAAEFEREYNGEEVNTKKSKPKKVKREKPARRKSARPIIILVLIAVIVVAISAAVISSNNSKEPEVTTKVIMEKIDKCGELTTAKMTAAGKIYFKDGKIPFITKKAFTMSYVAVIRAGIKLEDIDINVTKSKVTINVPEVKILDINIDPDLIEYYDETFTLLKGDQKADTQKAQQAAKKNAEEDVDVDELKTQAKEQIKELFDTLFKDSIGDRELVISFADDE